MRLRRIKCVAIGFTIVLAVYVGTFAYWWSTSPSKVVTENGRTTRYVDFQMTPFRWRTQILWIPAFAFMEYVCGYRAVSEVPAEHMSIYTYAK